MPVTGARPRIPTKAELDRIRYTPITAGFAPIAELSRQIANRRGLAADIDASGETKVVLLDVAELWGDVRPQQRAAESHRTADRDSQNQREISNQEVAPQRHHGPRSGHIDTGRHPSLLLCHKGGS
jgi:hypothetical protein